MIPIIQGFKVKYGLQEIVIIADAGLMSNKNIKELNALQYQYIIGARIKNETKIIQEQILDLKLADQEIKELQKEDGQRIIITYKESRSKNDLFNRTKGFEKLKEKVKAGKLSKEHVNNKGYNKYLVLKDEIKVEIDETKFIDDAKWDGLKGYVTNTNYSKEKIVGFYSQLWQVEKSFRIAKSDLQIRPIYHFKTSRIKAHICIVFAAYKLYRELERQLKIKGATKSVEQTIEILKTIFGLKLQMPRSKEIKIILLDKTDEQKSILKLFI